MVKTLGETKNEIFRQRFVFEELGSIKHELFNVHSHIVQIP